MKKIISIIGARPQFIKASVVSHAIKIRDNISEVVVHTGQHYDSNMSDVFFEELGISTPKYHLGIGGGHHGEMTGRMLTGIERVLLDEQPDVVMIYGDTNSTLAGALAAAKLHIPVAHIEAGLRSFNMKMPEEVNRVLSDRISHWLFAPTDVAVNHLIREGFSADQVFNVGDVMYDVALHYASKVSDKGRKLGELQLIPAQYVLATIHRAENTNNIERLTTIVNALKSLSNELPVVWPVHPRTMNVMRENELLVDIPDNLHLIEPIGYLDMVQLEKYAAAIATDSGGVQKEAFFYKVPCVTLRDETEWTELVDSGWNRLVIPDCDRVIKENILDSLRFKGSDISPYGDGDSARRIVDILTN